ncbi:MAG: chemotaxis protein CheX [Mycobacteriales bacterium]
MSAVDDDIREIAENIWETLFHDPLAADEDDSPLAEPAVTGSVLIEGAWNGAVMVQCESVLAKVLAGQLFRGGEPEPDDVRDTIGELTNMFAGNIKALLDEPSHISVPTVALGGDYQLTVLHSEPVATVRFRCADARMTVVLLRRSADGGR